MKTKMLMRRLLAVLFMSIWWSAQASAQEVDADLRSQIEALRQGQEQIQRQMQLYQDIQELKQNQKAIQKELQEIKKLIGNLRTPQQAEFKEVVIDVGDDPFQGDEAAKLALIEISDYQ